MPSERTGGVRNPRVAKGAAVATAFVFSIGFTFNGLNSPFGSPLVCLIGTGALLVFIALDPPPPAFWLRMLPVVALSTAAMAWATAPLWLPSGTIADRTEGVLVPDLTTTELLARIGYLAALLAGCLLARRRANVAFLIDALLLFGALNILAGLAARALDGTGPWEFWQLREDGRFTGTLSNANVAGVYYGVLAVLAAARAVASAGGRSPKPALARARQVGLWLMVLLSVGACAITASRSAMTASFVLLAVVAALPLVRQRPRLGTVVPLLLIPAVLLAVLVSGLSDLLLQRLDLISDEPSVRTLMWHHYLALAQRSPLFGYGLGSFPTLNQWMLGDPREAQALWMVNSPHNFVLQLLIEGGIPYLLLIVAVAVCVAIGIARAARSGVSDGREGFGAAIVIVLVCATLDIALDVPALVALVALMAGLLWPAQSAGSGFGIKSSSAARTMRHRNSSGA